MLKRLCNPSLSNSFFLFGARGTGKTTLLQSHLPKDKTLVFDLLDSQQYLAFAKNPELFYQEVKSQAHKYEWFVLDEVQKIPILLDSVHRLIFEQLGKFAITGSSARKLRRGGANLLAGRALLNYLFPLTINELGGAFEINQALSWGTLPSICLADNEETKRALLSAYVHTYLKEEIAAEQVVRRLDPFNRFLSVAADSTARIINYQNIANDVGVSSVTVQSYYQILEDTLVGFFLQPYHRSVRKRQRLNPKFYMFDCGVTRALTGTFAAPTGPHFGEYGNLFEQFIIAEILRDQEYRKDPAFNYYLRTHDGAEIDLIIERHSRPTLLIEIKSSREIQETELTVLEEFKKDFSDPKLICLCQVTRPRRVGNVDVLPYKEGLQLISSL